MTYWKGEKPPARHWKGEKRAFDFSDDSPPGGQPAPVPEPPEPEPAPSPMLEEAKAEKGELEEGTLEEWMPMPRRSPEPRKELSLAGLVAVCVFVIVLGGSLFYGIYKVQNHNQTADFTATIVSVDPGIEGTTAVVFDDGRKMEFKPGAIDGKIRIGDQVHLVCSRTYRFWSIKELEILAVTPVT